MLLNVFEVMTYGPIVAQNEEYGLLVTVNGAYFNLWVKKGKGFENTDCKPTNYENGIYDQDLVHVIADAETFLYESVGQEQEEALACND